MHSYTPEAATAAKQLRNPGGQCTSVLADTPKKQAYSTVLDPPQLHERDATVPNIRPNVYLAKALPREPSRIVRRQPEQTVAWPKHCVVSRSTWNLSPMRSVNMEPFSLLLRALESREIYYMSRDHSNAHELTNHIRRHPSPAPCLRSPWAPGKALRIRCGIVPVSPTGTKVCPGYSEWEWRTG